MQKVLLFYICQEIASDNFFRPLPGPESKYLQMIHYSPAKIKRRQSLELSPLRDFMKFSVNYAFRTEST